MAEDGDDAESKTEEPSERRKEKARSEGMIPFTKDLGTTLTFVGIVSVFISMGQKWLDTYRHGLIGVFSAIEHVRDHQLLPSGISIFITQLMWLMAVPLSVAFITPILAHVSQKGIDPMPEAAKPKFDCFDPIKGVQRLVSMETLVSSFKNIVRTLGLLAIFYLTLSPFADRIVFIAQMPLDEAFGVIGAATYALMRNSSILLITLTSIDYIISWRRTHKQLMMSRQELKEEMKESDGNPQIKQKLRQIQQEKSKRKIQREVPNATVIVTNPTHYAIALKYKKGECPVPRVLVKGVDALALRIREVARENGVPIIENPPLARAIYRDVKAGREIPEKYYKAVAKIVALIMRLEREKKAAQSRAYGRPDQPVTYS